MALYAIGDVQGCDGALGRLLDAIAFDPAADRLWLAGDLVNRGPGSLAVLRRLEGLGDRVVAVLGNHDLHLLGRALGVRRRRRRDTLEPVLAAPDSGALLAWLRSRPLLYREGDRVLVHAGIHPAWTVDEAAALAREAEGILQGPEAARLLEPASGGDRFDAELDRIGRARFVVNVLTRMRTVDAGGRLDLRFTGAPDAAPTGRVPWFSVPGRRSNRATIVCGHWAGLGLHVSGGIVALDTGCVWGDRLTACRLDDGAVFAVPADP